ncbi:MAG: transporter substrate-binding domain-containing protein, partial [Bacteroidales bacterium]|nr:transporter substrate-binding domain-containing protein [Bacteroidales bacterium]
MLNSSNSNSIIGENDNKIVAETSLFQSIDDLKGKKIGVLLGSIQDLYVTKHFPESEIIRVERLPDLTLSLANQKCDAIVIHREEGVLYLQSNLDFAYLEEV